jgi:ribose 1,5-bisphosphokinase PhnN
MMLAIPAGATSLALLALATVTPIMTEQAPALTLDVREHDGLIEVQLIGLSPHAQAVSYALEVTGQSTSRHRGSTTLAAGTRAVLSTMKTRAGDNWCVRLTAEEQGRAPYEITHGPCTAG